MKIVQYCPTECGIRFFSKIRKSLHGEFLSENIYEEHRIGIDFINCLKNRLDEYDVVIITAHGNYDAILRNTSHGYERLIKLNHTNIFRNDFVFAFACFTAGQFGRQAIQDNTITYIGFDDTIESTFKIEQTQNHNIKEALEKIIKSIYVESANKAIIGFIKKCQTAKQFYMTLSLLIQIKIAKTLTMSIEEINKKYEVNINVNDQAKIRNIIKLEITVKLSEFKSKMKILGEENFIPYYYIDSRNEAELQNILENIHKVNGKHSLYIEHIESKVNQRLEELRSNVTNF